MERLELSAEKRDIIGKHVKYLRRQGLVPAVVFGHAIESVSLQIPEKELRLVLRAAGTNRLISLNIGGQDAPIVALAREIQRDSITAVVKHVDFQAVVMTETLRTAVGLIFTGQSQAVIEGTGSVFHMLDHIEIECLPSDLISSITVDISSLVKIDDTLHVSDLQVPPAIKVLTPLEEPVVRIVHITEMPAEEIAEGTTTGEVEVIKKSKGEEEA